jgi:hypothetical protein
MKSQNKKWLGFCILLTGCSSAVDFRAIKSQSTRRSYERSQPREGGKAAVPCTDDAEIPSTGPFGVHPRQTYFFEEGEVKWIFGSEKLDIFERFFASRACC